MSSPDRIRTGVTALRGRRPRPLDDGAEIVAEGSASPARYTIPPPREWSQHEPLSLAEAPEISLFALQAGSGFRQGAVP